jgi:hypothetical protein
LLKEDIERMSLDNTGSSMGGLSGGDPKTLLMNQVRQEAALNNARQLIEVCFFALPLLPLLFPKSPSLPPSPRRQRDHS